MVNFTYSLSVKEVKRNIFPCYRRTFSSTINYQTAKNCSWDCTGWEGVDLILDWGPVCTFDQRLKQERFNLANVCCMIYALGKDVAWLRGPYGSLDREQGMGRSDLWDLFPDR